MGQKMMLREVQQDLAKGRSDARQMETDALPVRTISGGYSAAPKRRSDREEGPAAAPLAPVPAPLPPKAQEHLERSREAGAKADKKCLDYMELLVALTNLGFSTNDAELAARRQSSLVDAIQWLANKT